MLKNVNALLHCPESLKRDNIKILCTNLLGNSHKISFLSSNILERDCNKIRFLVKESLNITEHSAHKSLKVNIKSILIILFILLCIMYVCH